MAGMIEVLWQAAKAHHRFCFDVCEASYCFAEMPFTSCATIAKAKYDGEGSQSRKGSSFTHAEAQCLAHI
eukprot:scaffold2708_cov20-Tisochrysis_lutea.AAC.1